MMFPRWQHKALRYEKHRLIQAART